MSTRRFDLVLALAVVAMVGSGCGGTPCEEYCEVGQECGNLGFAPGTNCVNACEEAIDFVDNQNGCGAQLEEMVDCAAGASDPCNPQECVSEALDYLQCSGFD